jgi:hypothetical protein
MKIDGECVSPPGTASVSGTVLDHGGQPLLSVPVRLGGRKAMTGDGGTFELVGVNDQTDHLMVIDGTAIQASDGRPFIQVRRALDLQPGQHLELEQPIYLQPGNPPENIAGALEKDPSHPNVYRTKVSVTVAPDNADGLIIQLPQGTTLQYPEGATVGELSVTPLVPGRVPFRDPQAVAQSWSIGPPGLRILGADGEPFGWMTFANDMGLPEGTKLTLARTDENGQREEVGTGLVKTVQGGSVIETRIGPTAALAAPLGIGNALSWWDSLKSGASSVAGSVWDVRCDFRTIAGRVVTQDHVPARNATVYLGSPGGAAVATRITGPDGTFSFGNAGVCNFQVWAHNPLSTVASASGGGGTGTTDVGDLVIRPEIFPYQARVTVTDPLRRPWPGSAGVRATPASSGPPSTSSTGKDGTTLITFRATAFEQVTFSTSRECVAPVTTLAPFPDGFLPFGGGPITLTLRHVREQMAAAPQLVRATPNPIKSGILTLYGKGLAPGAQMEMAGVRVNATSWDCNSSEDWLGFPLPVEAKGGQYDVRVINPNGKASNTISVSVDKPLEIWSWREVDAAGRSGILTAGGTPMQIQLSVDNARPGTVGVFTALGLCLPSRPVPSPPASSLAVDFDPAKFPHGGWFSLVLADGCTPQGATVGRASKPIVFSVSNPVSTVTSVSPAKITRAMADAGFTLTVAGSGFLADVTQFGLAGWALHPSSVTPSSATFVMAARALPVWLDPRAHIEAHNPPPGGDGNYGRGNGPLVWFLGRTDCAADNGGCAPRAICENRDYQRFCTCPPPPWDGDGFFCEINCQVNNGGCHAWAICRHEVDGDRSCVCPAGTAGDGFTCTDVDECAVSNGSCSADATCTNQPRAAAVCQCKPGYTGDGRTCADVDECATNHGGCSPNAACTNTRGSATCACLPGFSGDGKICNDLDECMTANGGCSRDAVCANTAGARTCTCKGGFTGDGITCTDVNECTTANGGCHASATCTNTAGGRTCACKAGFTGDGVTCTDVDECATGNGGCHASATCTNTTGGRTCACKPGYTGDGLSCADVNECATGNGGCSSLAGCTNTPGSRTCTCASGYAGDGVTCTDVDECATGNGGCDPHASCGNTTGSRTCTCLPPYFGDGLTCQLG